MVLSLIDEKNVEPPFQKEIFVLGFSIAIASSFLHDEDEDDEENDDDKDDGDDDEQDFEDDDAEDDDEEMEEGSKKDQRPVLYWRKTENLIVDI